MLCAQEAERRPAIVGAARREIELRSAAVKLWEDSRPWVTEEERKGVEEKVRAWR